MRKEENRLTLKFLSVFVLNLEFKPHSLSCQGGRGHSHHVTRPAQAWSFTRRPDKKKLLLDALLHPSSSGVQLAEVGAGTPRLGKFTGLWRSRLELLECTQHCKSWYSPSTSNRSRIIQTLRVPGVIFYIGLQLTSIEVSSHHIPEPATIDNALCSNPFCTTMTLLLNV